MWSPVFCDVTNSKYYTTEEGQTQVGPLKNCVAINKDNR